MWKPNIATGFIGTQCDVAAFDDDSFVADLALLASAQMLVRILCPDASRLLLAAMLGLALLRGVQVICAVAPSTSCAIKKRAALQVGTPSAPLVYGFFMPRGSTVFELRPDVDAGTWSWVIGLLSRALRSTGPLCEHVRASHSVLARGA